MSDMTKEVVKRDSLKYQIYHFPHFYQLLKVLAGLRRPSREIA
jgi:hypothetical protein